MSTSEIKQKYGVNTVTETRSHASQTQVNKQMAKSEK